ncbi:DUF2849 domain-containing protein [Acuticoccus kandeliae]|uniref:DUF2849 domain-containing protein n=1 Tax=Acuticoccus kandeliae TaxID=2073160 RepID=UPI000D3E4BA8|nr:DUF2849 domain-containing protein [Acuticoccus kandeliae]
MAKIRRPDGPSVLTANEIMTGGVVFWTGNAWSLSLDDAVYVSNDDLRSDLEAIGKAEEAADRVVGAYLVNFDAVTRLPIELRERQRLAGPSIALPQTTLRAA